MRKIYTAAAIALLFTACRPSVSVTKPATKGNADFTNYLAIGDNYTAGYADNSLTVTGQLNSFPERLFEQFSVVGAKGPFIQPLLSSDNGFPGPKKVLAMTYSSCNLADSSLGPVDYPNFTENYADTARYVSAVNNGQINNMGVYGLRVVDFPLTQYALLLKLSSNLPYAYRFFNNPNTASPLDELQYRVDNLHPTFFTMWLGLNDVLGYAALAGGQGDGSGHALPIAGELFNQRDISNIDSFEKDYDLALNVAISTGSAGALINVPDITSMPFFTTIPVNGLVITRQTQADSLQALYPNTTPKVVFEVGANNFVIQDHNGVVRQAVPGEEILLTCPLDSLKCAGWGASTPIPEQYVLTTDELQNIRNFTTTVNQFIQGEAQRHVLCYVDMNTYLNTLSTGFAFNGINYSTQFVAGGAYSLDGIHFTQRGYALIANYIISNINSFYGSNIPATNANQYHGVDFP